MSETEVKIKNNTNNTKNNTDNTNEQVRIRRNNANLYPIYKMFSWDLLCFYSIEFLFYTLTKQVTASEILLAVACYVIAKIILQIPSVVIIDNLGRRKGIIIGNILLVTYMLVLMCIPGLTGLILANILCAFGYDIKSIAEPNLLYDSESTKGGQGLYAKLEAKGGSWYYYLNAVTSLSAGYLFVINSYLPLLVCLLFLVISTIISLKFGELYPVEKNENIKMKNIIKEYTEDLKVSVKFIIKSNRMKAFILFGAIFYGITSIMTTYQSDLLINKGVAEEEFSTIFALLSLLAAVSVTLSKKVQKKFRNKTLTFLSVSYVCAIFIIGVVSTLFTDSTSIPIILIMFAVLRICSAIWNVTKVKYLKNFNTEKTQNRIMFTYEFINGIVASIISIIGSIILDNTDINKAFIYIGIASIIVILLVLMYMKSRFGLKPSEYKKEDINFEI